MNKIITIIAKVSFAASLFMASGIGEAIKDFLIWVFDKSCNPDKFRIPGKDQLSSLFTSLFM